MTKREFERLMDKVIDVYGVRSSRIDGDEDLWFETPCCQDVIYYEDWADDEELAREICPICALELFE